MVPAILTPGEGTLTNPGIQLTMIRVEVVYIIVRVCGQLALDPLVSLLLPLHAATVGGLREAKLVVCVWLARTGTSTCGG